MFHNDHLMVLIWLIDPNLFSRCLFGLIRLICLILSQKRALKSQKKRIINIFDIETIRALRKHVGLLDNGLLPSHRPLNDLWLDHFDLLDLVLPWQWGWNGGTGETQKYQGNGRQNMQVSWKVVEATNIRNSRHDRETPLSPTVAPTCVPKSWIRGFFQRKHSISSSVV